MSSAHIVDGKVVANYTAGTSLNKEMKGSDSLNKDAFLKILVAEMQYQDPMQPSSNTDWVTQMASFSQIEEMQGVGDTLKEQQAGSLVGKRVIVQSSIDTTGEAQYVTGVVQCTEKKEDGIYISVNDMLFPVDNIYAVVDEDYYNSVLKK